MATKAKTEDKKLTFAEYTAMAAADLFVAVKQYAVKPVEAFTTAKEKLKGTYHDAAISVAALKRLYTKGYEEKNIPGDWSFAKYFAKNVGGDLPGRVEAGASLFNTLVLTVGSTGNAYITEEIFRDAAPDWLEKASAILNAAQKNDPKGWQTCDDVLDMVNALSKPGDAAKKLKEIRNRQKGVCDAAESGDAKAPVAITPELAAEYLMATIKSAKADDAGKTLFTLTQKICDAWQEDSVAKVVTTETQETWFAEYRTALAHGVADHIKVVTAETPALVAA